MADATVQRNTGGGFSDIEYLGWTVTYGINDHQIVPEASVETHAKQAMASGDLIRIRVDGSTVFSGAASSGGDITQSVSGVGGARSVTVEGRGSDTFEATVDVDEGGPPTDQDVLSAALSNAGSGLSLSYDAATPVTLNDEYAVENRTVKNICRDMMDRTDRIFWVDTVAQTLHVDALGATGTFGSVTPGDDAAVLRRWEDAVSDTVVNDVTVVGTGDEKVEATAEDSSSISSYGRRSRTVNVSYITSEEEAQAMADSLLDPDPSPQGRLLVGENAASIYQNPSNQSVTVTDDLTGLSSESLPITKAVLRNGHVEFHIGAGAVWAPESVNRRNKSRGDLTEPGSTYGEGRIADDSITTAKLVDTAVTEQKLADLAVATSKLQNNAVINGKLSDLSVSETKIQDDSIATPKLQAEAVTANEIESDTITAAEIAAGTITALEILSDTITANEIAAGTITALEIESDTITANEIAASTLTAGEIDALFLNASQLEVSEFDTSTNQDQGFEFSVITNNPVADDTVALEPKQDRAADIGTENRRFRGWFDLINVDSLRFPSPTLFGPTNPTQDELTLTFGSFGAQAILSHSGAANEFELYPETDDTGQIGSPVEAWSDMYSHNYVTASPDPIDGGVDLDELRSSAWHDPPRYVSATTDAIVTAIPDDRVQVLRDDPDRHDPEDMVELGTMANYLLEACKAQQAVIDDLSSRVADLER